jgi:hypothetical protein
VGTDSSVARKDVLIDSMSQTVNYELDHAFLDQRSSDVVVRGSGELAHQFIDSEQSGVMGDQEVEEEPWSVVRIRLWHEAWKNRTYVVETQLLWT